MSVRVIDNLTDDIDDCIDLPVGPRSIEARSIEV
jgi:hypothetical protein